MAPYRVSAAEKEAIVASIRAVLLQEQCVVGLLFGSFLTGDELRDNDLCVAWDQAPAADSTRTSELAAVLEAALPFRFDVVPLNVEDVLLRASIATRFQPIVDVRPDLIDAFVFEAWIDIQDFRPRIEAFYAERFGVEQGQAAAAFRDS
ncbi:MAG: hypothetical protein AB1634_04270 [Thermodesulfobacteriota bacterium]